MTTGRLLTTSEDCREDRLSAPQWRSVERAAVDAGSVAARRRNYSAAVTSDPRPPSWPALRLLDAVAAEIEAHVAAGGWDQRPQLFALVPTQVVAGEPEGASVLGLSPGEEISDESLTPIAQEALEDKPLDELLAGIQWPGSVTGCALSQEIIVLPPDAEQELSSPDALGEAVVHPDRREARLVVAVTRAGAMASVLRLRSGTPGEADDIAFGADLAPNLTAALRATLD